ncbi:MAG: hypothetical protein C0390_13825 [Syntrophus sp. (in: bacteria)]|nr:hypothetical protein [Syntrophus sp. (in: bacteria)]
MFLILFLMVRGLIRGEAQLRERIFWVLFVVLGIVLGIAVHGERSPHGLAHVGLQPLVHLGLVFLAVSLPTLPRTLRGIALFGMAIDFIVGISLHLHLESLMDWGKDGNIILKHEKGLGEAFLGDWLVSMNGVLQGALLVLGFALLAWAWWRLDRLPDAFAWSGRLRSEAQVHEEVAALPSPPPTSLPSQNSGEGDLCQTRRKY